MRYCFQIRIKHQRGQLMDNNIIQQQEEEEAVGNGVMESHQGLVFISSVDIKDKKKRRKMGDGSTQEEEDKNEEEVMVVTKKPRREEEGQLINDLPRQSSETLKPGTRPKPLSLSRISEIEEKNREILEEYHEFKF